MIDRWDVLTEGRLRVTTENLINNGLYVALASVADGGVNFAFGVEVLATEHRYGELVVMHKRHRIIIHDGEPAMVLGSGEIITSPAAELGLVLGQPHPYVCIDNDSSDLILVSRDPFLVLA